MQKKINFIFALICAVLVTFVSFLAYDSNKYRNDIRQLQDSITSTQQELQLVDDGVNLTYNKLFGVYRIAKQAYFNVCGGDRQFKFDCLLDDWEYKSWREDLLSNE